MDLARPTDLPKLPFFKRRKNHGPRLNAAFCLEHGVVPLEWGQDKLTVGMVNPAEERTIDALRFATGLAVIPVAIEADEIPARLREMADHARGQLSASVKKPAPPVAANDIEAPVRGRSLTRIMSDWFDGQVDTSAPLPILSALLAKGFTPAQAGGVVVAAHAAGVGTNDAETTVSETLGGGTSLEQALGAVSGVPPWLAHAMAAVPVGTDCGAVLVSLSECDQSSAYRRAAVRRVMGAVAIAALPLAIAWWVLWPPVAIAIAVLSLLAIVRLKQLIEPGGDLFRAGILELVAVLARHGVSDAAAIRCALERLRTVSPTWGRLPDSREEFAQALDLDPLAGAIFGQLELALGASAAADLCQTRGGRVFDRGVWTYRMAAIAMFGFALAAAVS